MENMTLIMIAKIKVYFLLPLDAPKPGDALKLNM